MVLLRFWGITKATGPVKKLTAAVSVDSIPLLNIDQVCGRSSTKIPVEITATSEDKQTIEYMVSRIGNNALAIGLIECCATRIKIQLNEIETIEHTTKIVRNW